MKVLNYIPGWLLLLLWINQPVFSQLRDTVDLDEVVVTGEMKPVLTDKSLYQIKSISAREIRGRGATNLGELLSNDLSFSVSHDASLGSTLRLNGLSGEHVKILVDGVPLVGRQSGILDLTQISLFKIDHIEIVEGPMSVIYGSNALGGVVNIISQRPVFGNRSMYKIGTYYESVGVYNVDADAVVKRNKHAFTLNGGRHFFGGFSAPNDNFRSKTWKPKLQWNGNLDYALKTDKIKLNIGSSLFSEELRNKGNPGDNPERALDEYHFTTRSMSKMDFSAPLSKDFITTVLASYSYYKKRKSTYVKDLVTLEEQPYGEPTSQDTTTFDNIMGRWMVGGKLTDRFDMQSGVEYNYEKGNGKRIKGEEQSISEAAAFGTLKYNILKVWDLQAGLRYIHNSRFETPLIYNFNTRWDVNSKAQVRISYGKGFRAPSLKELYLEFVDINHNVLGNDSLKAEESVYVGVSADYKFNDALSASFNIYQNEIKNKIDLLYDTANAAKAKYFNLSGKKTTTRGLKLSVNYNFNNKLRIQAGGQLNGQSKIASNRYNWSTDASVNGSYNFLKLKSKLAFYYKYNGKFIFYTGSYDNIGRLESVNENFLDKYHSLDVIVTKWLWSDKLEVSTGVKNIFDNTNILGRGSSGVHGGGDGGNSNPVGWGRTFFVQLQLNLNYDHKNSNI